MGLSSSNLLTGVRVVECTLLEPGSVGMILGEMGADVVKVEPPGGDYVRTLGWPFVDGVSILHWHVNKAKRSIQVDLRTEAGAAVFEDLVRTADVVVEGMRPGALERRGLGYERLAEINPRVVLCSISGFGATGPYRDLPSHGVGFDAWAGVAPPAHRPDGTPYLPDHTSIGTKVGAVWAALGISAAVLRARETGAGCHLDIAQSDAAAYANWLPIEGTHAYRRPEPEVTGNPADGGARRPAGPGGMEPAVRYQYYATSDGHVLFMASEQEFWRNFCVGVGRADLFETHPGRRYGDHATGDTALRREVAAVFAGRTTADWTRFGLERNCPIVPVNDPASITADPQFADRLPWLPREEYHADLLPIPVNVVGAERIRPRVAPHAGQHSEEVLAELGYPPDRVAGLLRSGAVTAAEPPTSSDHPTTSEEMA